MSSSALRPDQMAVIEQPPPTSALYQSEWQEPDYILPVPSLRFAFHLECGLEPPRHVGPGPHGDRSTVFLKEGRFEGPGMRGEILPGGADWQTIQDHDSNQQTAHLDARYNLLTHDGANIYVQSHGTRTGKRDVLKKLSEGGVPADQFRMRLHLTLETGDERYNWVNQGVFVASAGKAGNMVIYDAYQLL